MRNTIIYNLNEFSCDCLSMINDGSNVLAIEARKRNYAAPKISLTLADGTAVQENLKPVNGFINYEIPESYYKVSGNITFKITDGEYNSPVITIAGATNDQNNDLTLVMESDTKFTCKISAVTPSGGDFGDEWKSAINANTVARHSHNNKGVLDAIETALTNTEIEALLEED